MIVNSMSEQSRIETRDRTLFAMTDDIAGFHLSFKDKGRLFAIFDRHMSRIPLVKRVWSTWMNFTTTFYPRVHFSNTQTWNDKPLASARTLQHEWVHLKDAETFFGFMPKELRYLNVLLFSMAYASPQIIALLTPLAMMLDSTHSYMWLFLLTMLLPIPSPMRMYAEIRAYRRSRELGADMEHMTEAFATMKYWKMWPFKQTVMKLLMEPSPYKHEMDVVWQGHTEK